MENLSSEEYYLLENREPQRILEDISLSINRKECWGISGRTAFDIRLLLEIMANIRPYGEGRCVLTERGMMRQKRKILQHVFYISSSEMIYDNMNVLEYLMFSMGKFKKGRVILQEEVFEFIIGIGLGHISLTKNKLLTREEKSVVALIAAAYSDSLLIVFNLPEYDFDDVLTDALAKLSHTARERGKALVLGTNNFLLVEKACSHAAFILNGRIVYRGTVEDLRMLYDKVEVIIRDDNLDAIAEKLAPLLPGYAFRIKKDSLLVICDSGITCDKGLIYEKIIGAGITPKSIEMNPKTVQNAYEEFILPHDL